MVGEYRYDAESDSVINTSGQAGDPPESSKNNNHLVIGDPHADVGISNRRFYWANQLIKELKPKVVIVMGDLWDLPSLCHHDKGTKASEGRRLVDDIAVGQEAMRMLSEGLVELNIRLVFIVGNHEYRIEREANTNPEFHEMIGTHSFCIEDYGWEVFDFLQPCEIDGVVYQHYLPSGTFGRPVGGVTPSAMANGLLNKANRSITVGHDHRFAFGEQPVYPDGKMYACSAGCYLDEDQWMDYAGVPQKQWWSGIIHKKNVQNGMYTLEQISIQELRSSYG